MTVFRNGRCGVVDLPHIVLSDRPTTNGATGPYSLLMAGPTGRINDMSDATRDAVPNDSRIGAVWDWCVLFLRTVTAPQAVFWFLLWNVIRPRQINGDER